jgi:hypothetical protein
MTTLKRTQVYFPEDMLEALKSKAKKEKTTIADIVRKAVSEILKKEEMKDWENDPLWNIVGAGSSEDGDLSINHDKYLYGLWTK